MRRPAGRPIWASGLRDPGLVARFHAVAAEVVTGTYMMHCHNLVHEDHDMMSQFRVLNPDGSTGTDPLSEPALPLPEIGQP